MFSAARSFAWLVLPLALSLPASAQQAATPSPIAPHPDIGRVLQAMPEGARLVELRGFVGPTSADGMVKLYTSLTLSSYFEVPLAAIVSSVPTGDARTAPTNLLVREDAIVGFVLRDRAGVVAAASRPPGPGTAAMSTRPRIHYCLYLLEACMAGQAVACFAYVGCSAGEQMQQ